MIDAVPDKKIVKINATVDDDINLILDAITKVDAAFVLLVLPEGNDLANSPIGLKALRKKTYEKGKRMILVVPQGMGYQLAKKAGFIASTSQDAVTGDVWQTAVQQYDEYYQSEVGMNSKKELPHHIEKKIEYINPVTEHLPIPEIISGGGGPVKEMTAEGTPIDAPEEIKEKAPRVDSPNVTGMDFSKLVRQGKTSFFGKAQKSPMTAGTAVPPQEINSFNPDVMPQKVGTTIARVGQKKEVNLITRFILLGLVGAIIAGLGIFIAYYMYFPRVRIDLQIQSEALSMSDVVTATSAVTGFDVNKKEIQLTKEKIEKNGSEPFDPTVTGTDGTKATGIITVNNSDPATKTVPVGTLVTSSGGKKFVVSGGSSVVVDVSAPMPVTATDFGEDYNLPSSSTFTITGFPTLSGQNSSAFSGGTIRTFKVVGQKDIDAAVKLLQADLAKQASSDLSYLNLDNGYQFIPESVVTTPKDKPTVTPALGTEIKSGDDQPSVAMYTTSTALYYHAESLSKLAEQLLLNKYKADKNLSADAAANTSIENLAVKVDKVTVQKDGTVTLNFTATGLATAKLDVEKIRNDIAALNKWSDMLDYLSKLPALASAPSVKFFPTWLPDFARYVPHEVSRIDVGVTVVAPVQPTSP